MTAVIKGDQLIISIPVNKIPKPSSSGKTLIIATSGGNKQTDLVVADQKVVVGLNAYIYAEKK